MKKAVLFIHGLSAKKVDNEYFLNKMRDYRNIDIYTFLLPGHDSERVKITKYNQWIERSEIELKKILLEYKNVTIVSHSMGTIIAINLASRYKEVCKLVLISPAFIFGNLKQNKVDLRNIIRKTVDKEVGTGFEGVIKKFIMVPTLVMIEYRKMSHKNRENIRKIKCPTLIMHGNIDNVIPIESSKFVYDNLRCKKNFVLINGARHQVFKSIKKEIITTYIYNFICFNFLYEINKKKVI